MPTLHGRIVFDENDAGNATTAKQGRLRRSVLACNRIVVSATLQMETVVEDSDAVGDADGDGDGHDTEMKVGDGDGHE